MSIIFVSLVAIAEMSWNRTVRGLGNQDFFIEIGKKSLTTVACAIFSDVCLFRNVLCQTKNIDKNKYIPIYTAANLAQMNLPISRSDGTKLMSLQHTSEDYHEAEIKGV